MKKTSLQVLMIACTCFLYSGCEENSEPSAISGKLTGHSDCKSFKSQMFTEDTPDTLSCISYLFDASAGKLQLTHINAGFNCCPGKLWCEISQQSDTIIIKEGEKEQGCDCNCLFDLEMELSGIEAQEYVMTLIEPYAEDQEPLIFTIDLASVTEGTHCVIRKEYPWGMF